MISILFLIIGLAAGLAVMYIAGRPSARRYSDSQSELKEKNGEIIALNREIALGSAHSAALEEKLERQKEDMADLQERSRIEFKNLANEILEEKTKQFKDTNKESLESLLKPFKNDIEGFRKRVDEVYDKEAQQRFSLKEEIKNLNEMNKRMSEEANNLTNALKGNSKIQGDWGEMILETILDSSNLIKGIHYRTQENLKDEAGNNVRPDVIITLPDNKQIVVDSKVSLTAYTAYAESETPEQRKIHMDRHVRSIRSHVDELGSKRYQNLVNSPDFVIMFIPNEPAFLLALQSNSAVWNEAYDKKVIISSPTNLFALLKIVDDLWKRDSQSKNAINIAKEGGALYDKFVGFYETLTDVGKSIDSASRNYEKAMKQLQDGKGSLTTRAEKLRELGVKASKNLPAQLTDYDE